MSAPRVVLVTGTRKGIGRFLAEHFVKAGDRVVGVSRSAPDWKLDGYEHFCADVADERAVKDLFLAVRKRHGRLDALVNNAGIASMSPIDRFSLEEFDRTFAINVRAVFVATQAAIRHMKDGGRVINIGSCNAERMPFAGGAAYAMSKSALQGLVKGLARDLGPRGITINNVQPGPVDTDLNPAQGEFAEMLKKLMALPRYSAPDEIAAMVAYLASPEAGFVTGASLTIDGGFTA